MTEEKIDYLLGELLDRRCRLLTVDDPRTLDRLTRDLIVLESLRILLHAQQTYLATLEGDDPAP